MGHGNHVNLGKKKQTFRVPSVLCLVLLRLSFSPALLPFACDFSSSPELPWYKLRRSLHQRSLVCFPFSVRALCDELKLGGRFACDPVQLGLVAALDTSSRLSSTNCHTIYISCIAFPPRLGPQSSKAPEPIYPFAFDPDPAT
ncbi:hypothetical protein FOVSG1_014066 [Fusarium oxysporum f. sp. vasinfectum]